MSTTASPRAFLRSYHRGNVLQNRNARLAEGRKKLIPKVSHCPAIKAHHKARRQRDYIAKNWK